MKRLLAVLAVAALIPTVCACSGRRSNTARSADGTASAPVTSAQTSAVGTPDTTTSLPPLAWTTVTDARTGTSFDLPRAVKPIIHAADGSHGQTYQIRTNDAKLNSSLETTVSVEDSTHGPLVLPKLSTMPAALAANYNAQARSGARAEVSMIEAITVGGSPRINFDLSIAVPHGSAEGHTSLTLWTIHAIDTKNARLVIATMAAGPNGIISAIAADAVAIQTHVIRSATLK
jgi:hypothetical protein